ncbi:MAG: hypothetical protein ABSG22_02685 [Sedimentisphaerales bacterium]
MAEGLTWKLTYKLKRLVNSTSRFENKRIFYEFKILLFTNA